MLGEEGKRRKFMEKNMKKKIIEGIVTCNNDAKND